MASLKHGILEYMLLDPESGSLQRPIPKSKLESGRGFNHPDTAALLCPVRRIERFVKDDM